MFPEGGRARTVGVSDMVGTTDLWVSGLEGGSESLVGGEETGRMKGLSKKRGCEGGGQRLRTERREKNQIKALFSKF